MADYQPTRQKDIAMEVIGLAHIVHQIQQLTQVILAQIDLSYLKLALIVRTDLLTYVTLGGYTIVIL